MFPLRTSTLAQRALGALRLVRSFMLLESDYRVDWEVDRSRGQAACIYRGRAQLRERQVAPARRRRAGQPRPEAQVCTSPVGGRAGIVRHRTSRRARARHARKRYCLRAARSH